MSMAHDIRITALEKRCEALERAVERLQAIPGGSGQGVANKPLSELPRGFTGNTAQDPGTKPLVGFQVVRRPGRGPARFNVEQEGTPINTQPLSLQDAEALADNMNEATEPLETA